MADERTVAEIETLAQRRPALVALARLASVAAIIEPPLLRRLRLEVGGLAEAHTAVDTHNAWHAGLEADLWFSRLAHVATPNQMTLRPAVLAILRDQLTDPRHHAEARAARAVVEDAHREHSDMIQLEELIIWATLTGHTDDVGAALDRALATLHADAGRATGVVRWFTQARRRIPPEALAHPAGQRLLAATALHLDHVIPRELLVADRFPDRVSDLAPRGLPTTEVGIILMSNGIRFTTPGEPNAGLLTVPDTRPPIVEATWEDVDGVQHVTLARADQGHTTPLAGMSGRVTLRTLTGQRFAVHPADARRLVVAVFGALPEWLELETLSRLLSESADGPEVDVVAVPEPSDVYDRPEVVVLGHNVTVGNLESFLPAFGRAVRRSIDHGARGPTGVIVEVAGTNVKGVEVPGAEHVRVQSAISSSGVAELLQAVVARPPQLYALDVDTALTMLNSVALAFHVRAFYGPDVADEEAEALLFGLGEEAARSDTFTHVRVMCEYVFAGPCREYLSGEPDPAANPPDPKESYAIARPGWSPVGQPWESFSHYLDWFVGEFVGFARVLRDRLGDLLVPNRYAVPAGVLQGTRAAVGTAALPPDHDEPAGWGWSSVSAQDDGEATLYRVERRELPTLIGRLAVPVLAAVAAEDARRMAAEPPSHATLIVTLSADDTMTWQFGESGQVTQPTTGARSLHNAAQLIRNELVDAHSSLNPRLHAAGRLIAEVFPIDVWTYLRSTAWPAGVEILSAIDVPWELATMDTPLHPDLPPLLGCQMALAIWPLESPRVRRREGDLAVRGIATLSPDGGSAPLLSRLGARHYAALPEVLGDDSDIDVVHIAAEVALKSEGITLIELPSSPFVMIAGQVSVNLAIAFLRAGASAVVAAMSSVNYVDEKEFAERFYTEVLLESTPIAEALRRLRCQSGPVGATALAYRYFGHPDLRLRWSGRPA